MRKPWRAAAIATAGIVWGAFFTIGALAQPADPCPNHVGFYFDEGASLNCTATAAPFQSVTGYLCVTNLTELSGVSSWECTVEIVGAGLVAPGWTIRHGGVNFLTPQEFAVGIGTVAPAPWAPSIVLASMTGFVQMPGNPVTFAISAAPNPSIPGHNGMVIAAGNDVTNLIAIHPAAGYTEGEPNICAAINPSGPCPQVGICDDFAALAPLPEVSGPIRCDQSAIVAFHFTPSYDSPPVRGYSVQVQATSAVSFTASDITVNSLPPGDQTFYQIIENAPNDYTIDYTILGMATQGITGEADLFTVEFNGSVDGTGTVSIGSAQIRDLQNQPIEIDYSAVATVVVDCAPPGPVAGITAARGHQQVTVSWTDPADEDLTALEIWRGLWHDPSGASVYPEYDDVPNVIPTRPVSRAEAEASPEWTLAGTVAPGVEVFVDAVAPRGVYYYEVFAEDDVSFFGAAAATNAWAFNYWLGDFTCDGYVGVDDLTILGAAYGTLDGGGGYNAEVDVGPTSDASAYGIPLTDNAIDFEDMMIVGLNFGATQPRVPLTTAGPVRLAWTSLGEGCWNLSLLQPAPNLMGLHLTGSLPVGTTAQLVAGELLAELQSAVFLRDVRGDGLDISLGVMGASLNGEGELFRVVLSSSAEVGAIKIDARSTTNEKLDVAMEERAPSVPVALRLYQNVPNPFNPSTLIRFDLPTAGHVQLRVYDVSGRLIRTLVDANLPASSQQVVWDGKNERGQGAASGSYFVRMEVGGKLETSRMTLVR